MAKYRKKSSGIFVAEYYYIISSMPYLRFQERPPLSHEAFFEQCALWLSNEAFLQLSLGLLSIEDIPQELIRNDLLSRWVSFENTLRNELVKFRAGNLGVQGDVYIGQSPGFESWAVEAVQKTLQFSNPYEREIALLKARWDFLSHHETGHYFDLTALIIYGLKLQILERIKSFSEEKGREILNMICERNLYGQPQENRQGNGS